MIDLNPVLDECKDLSEVFDVVKRAVEFFLGQRRAGLMLGLADLPSRLVGFYVVGSNIIVLNENIYNTVTEESPDLLNIWSFRVLLHEYLHTLGYLRESEVRRLVQEICQSLIDGWDVRIALSRYQFYNPPRYMNRWGTRFSDLEIKLVEGFEKSSTKYIA